MDLTQRKLKKSEWESIEIPVSRSEIDILRMIIDGYSDVNIRSNNNMSLFMFLKIEYTPKMEDYLYNKYFKMIVDNIQKNIKVYNKEYKDIKVDINIKINSADKIRLERNDNETIQKQNIYELVLLGHIENIFLCKKQKNNKLFMFHYYTLSKLLKNNISKINKYILEISNKVIALFENDIEMSLIIEHAVEFIEKNASLLKYGDLTLYEHQKEIFTMCKNPQSKLILYIAPTGTGKTLTPIALSEKHRIIFVCAARHVGLALARCAISMNKKIAFAFGCSSAADIRLHYFAAKEFTRHKKSGGIKKVDNSVGDNVEIMICDIRSYLSAMYYMLAFNKKENIIMYWDEPTITLDYDKHDLHKIIHKNWKDNTIPNIVLSSATLPKLNELTETISDFKSKFPGSCIYNIVSHDCKKSIPIINKDGFVVLPHYLNEYYDNILEISKQCENNLTLLRYFDLKEVVDFITYVNNNNFASSKMRLSRHFETIDEINMTSIKIYYIKILQNILLGTWGAVFMHFKSNRVPRILSNDSVDTKGNKIASVNNISKVRSIGPGVTNNSSDKILSEGRKLAGQGLSRLASEQGLSRLASDNIQVSASSNIQSSVVTAGTSGTSGIYVTTKDAYTLTDGPTIFISNEIEKIAKFCIQQANIPALVMDEIMKKIEYNNVINQKLHELENQLDYIKEQAEKNIKNEVSEHHKGMNVNGRNKSLKKDPKKFNRETGEGVSNKGEMSKLTTEINTLRAMIKSATLNETFVPNKPHHIKKWTEGIDTKNAYSSSIDETIVNEIMTLNGIDDSWKILLMMGIGVFMNHDNIRYTEIMKKLADEQKLYMIIASSDFIYGTNYQFCHSYLSKDLDLTQEKIIQAMGRVGRNNIQQTYTIRFRDDAQILKLFTSETDKPEIINMNRLFNTRKIVWQDNEYVELPDEEEEEEKGSSEESEDNESI